MGGDTEEHVTLELGRTVGARGNGGARGIGGTGGTGGAGGVCEQEAQEGGTFALVMGEQMHGEAEVHSASAIRG